MTAAERGAPRSHEREVVVDLRGRAGRLRRGHDLAEPGPVGGQGLPVGRGEEADVVLPQRGVGFLRRAGGEGGAQCGDPTGGHAVEIAVRGVRAEGGHAHGGGDPVGQQGGTGEGVGAAAGVAHDREPVHAERVGDRGGVAGGRGDVRSGRGVEPP